MLTITEEQIAALGKAAKESFEKRMTSHLNEYFAAECRRAGESGIRDAIRQGSARAAERGFVAEVDVARYIDIDFVLKHGLGPREAQATMRQIADTPGLNARTKLRVIFEEVMRMRAAAANSAARTH